MMAALFHFVQSGHICHRGELSIRANFLSGRTFQNSRSGRTFWIPPPSLAYYIKGLHCISLVSQIFTIFFGIQMSSQGIQCNFVCALIYITISPKSVQYFIAKDGTNFCSFFMCKVGTILSRKGAQYHWISRARTWNKQHILLIKFLRQPLYLVSAWITDTRLPRAPHTCVMAFLSIVSMYAVTSAAGIQPLLAQKITL